MPNPDNIKLLYNELKDSYDIESEDAFREYLSDANNREALRKELEADYDVGDSASFATYLGFGNEPPQAPVQPVAETPQDEEEFGPDTTMRDGTVVKGKPTTASSVGGYDMDANAEKRQRMYKAGMTAGENIAQPFHKEIGSEILKRKAATPKEQPLQTAEPTQVQPQAQEETPQAPQSAQEAQTNYEPSGTPWLKENEPKPWETAPWNTRNAGDNKAVNEEWKAARQEQTATTQQLVSGTSSADAWKQNATAMRRMDNAEFQRRVRGEEFDNTDNNFETFYQTSVAPTFKTERARADEEGTKAAAQYPSVTDARGMTVPNVMAAAAYEKATDPAVVTQNVLANLDGNALSQYVERRMHVDEQPMMGGIERQLTEEELNLVRDLIAAENGDVVTKLQQRMYQDYINEGGNMTTAGYILGNGFRNSLLMRLQDAIVTRIAGSSGLRKQFLDMAYQRAGERAGAIARGVSGAVTMIADAPAFGVAGKVAAPVARGVIGAAGKAIAGRAAGELGAAAAERFIVANSRLGRVAENMLQSGLTFSGYDVMSEGVNQFQQGQFDAGELVNRAIKGFGTGAAVGVLGGATGELTKELTGVAKGVGKAYGFAAEVGLFTGMQGLEMAAELGIPITDVDWGALTIENAAMLGVLKLQSMPFRARMAKDVDLALNEYDIEELRRRGYDFGSVAEGLRSLKTINSGGEVNYTDKSGKPYSAGEQRKVNAMYAKFLADKDIPIDVKRKVRFYLEGEFTPYEPVFGMSEVQMGNGGTATFETYSADGSVISRERFNSAQEAEGRRTELMDQVAVNQLSAYMRLAEHPLSNIHKMANMEAKGKGNAERERLWDIIDRASRGEELTQEEADTYLELYNNAADYGVRTSAEIFNGVAKNVKGRTGIDVQSLLADKTRKAVDWAPEEREAVHTYLDEIGRTLEFRGAFAEMQLRGSQEGAKVRIEGVPEEPIDEPVTPQDGGGVPPETVEQAGAEYNDALSRLLALDGGTEMKNRIDGLLNVENSIDEEFVSEFIGSYGALGEELYNACMDYAKAEAKRRAVEAKAQQAADDIQKGYGETFEPAVNEDGRLTMGVYDGQSVVIKNWDNESDLVKILDAQGNETTVRKADIENVNLGMPFDEWVRMNTAGRVQTIFNNVNIAYQPQESVGGGLGMPQGVNGEGGAKPAEDGGPSDFPQGEIPPTGDNSPTPPTEPENIAPTEPTQPRTEGGMPLYEEGGKLKPDFKNATSEETYNYLYGERKMNRDDINAFVRNKVSDAEKRLKKLEGKRPKMGTDLDEFEDKVNKWEQDKTDTQKELDYWNDVQQRAKQENLDEQRENADLAAQWKKVAALDDAVSLHEYLMRQVYGGLKFIWENNENGTKGLGAHLGLGDGAEKRSRRWMIGKQENGAMYPEKAAEVLAERYSADTGNKVEYDDVFNTLLDILRGYDKKSVLGNDILKEHNAGQFNEDAFNKEDEKRSKDAWAVEHGFEDFDSAEDYMKSLEGTERPEGEGNGNPPVLTDELETQEPKEQPTEPAAEPQGTVEETPKAEQPSEPKAEQPIEPKAEKKEEKKEKPSISKEGWNGYKVGDSFDWQLEDGKKEKVQIVAFDRSNSQDGTPEIVLRHYDEQGNLTGTEAYPPLAFDEEVKRQKALQKPAEPKGTFNPIEEAKKNVEEKENTESEPQETEGVENESNDVEEKTEEPTNANDENEVVEQPNEEEKAEEETTNAVEEKKEGKKEPKTKPSKDNKIEDFGEKIGGARKDVARGRIRDTVNMSVKDLSTLKNGAEDILSQKNIIRLFKEGQMDENTSRTFLAYNNLIKTINKVSPTPMKEIALKKYRDAAVAWEEGKLFSFDLTQEDIDKYKEAFPHATEERIREVLDYRFTESFNMLINTYKAIDYPAVNRKVGQYVIEDYTLAKSLKIPKILNNPYWLKNGLGARRGFPFPTFEAAVKRLLEICPVVEEKGKKEKGEKAEHGLRVVRDGAWYYVKSRNVPGNIYLSKSFWTEREAKEYLENNLDKLIEKEQRLVDALLGSNIGMAEREGVDYRNGKTVKPQDFLDEFGFRGVEFGNWVPQGERQMYLDKTYDAIMDFCAIVGISPKAFSLGGKLGLAFGARGHSRAMAHYEPAKVVINLTRMNGVGSLAHEWFHALDNYLAKEKSGNMSDMATKTHDVVREELSDVFKQMYSTMRHMDYNSRSRRAGEYWGRTEEEFARLFENYIYNKLEEKKTVSPILVRKDALLDEVDEDMKKYWPYPSVEENAQMKPLFDKLFDTIQEKTDEDGKVVLFREGNGKIEATPDLGYTKKQAERYRERVQKRMRGHVAEMAEKMHMTDKVVVHDTAEGLKGRYATAKGWYDNKTGKIHVVIDNNRNIFDVMMTMMHEGVAHYGLRQMCGEHFDAFLDDVFANADESIKSAIRDKMDSMRNKDKNKKSEEAYRRAATEEYMADVAEQMEFSDAPPASFKSWWSKIKDLFLEMWGKLGLGKYFGPTITDNEIRYILWRSWQNLVNPGRYKNPFAVEEERAKAEERIEPKVEAKVETPKEDTQENVLVAADNTKVVGSNQGAKGFISTTQGDDYTFEQKTKMLDTYRMIKENYNAIALLNTPTGYVLINDGAKAARKVFGLDDNPFVVVDKEGLDEVLPRMIRAGYRLAIADVMTDNKVSEDDVDVFYNDETEEIDKEYSDAVKERDYDKVEQILADAAKVAMPDTKVVDENGNPKVVYHGSKLAEFYYKDGYPYTRWIDRFNVFNEGKGYFTDNEQDAKNVGSGNRGLYKCYLNITKPYVFDAKGARWDDIEFNGEKYRTTDTVVKWAREQGEYDGVIIKNVIEPETQNPKPITDYVAFSPNQIKSAMAEYDDNGNLIPLSERFNEDDDDIRFRDGEESGDIFVSNALRAVDGIKQEKATPEQWLKMIEKSGGLKAGEDKWMGLSDWLKGSDKKTLTKQEVQDFIRQNQIEIEEVSYVEGMTKEAQDKLDAFNQEFEELIWEGGEATNSVYTSDWVEYAYNEMVNRYGDDFRDAFDIGEGTGTNSRLTPTLDYNDDISGAAKYFLGMDGNEGRTINSTRLEYTTRWLLNNREIALVVPTIEPWNENDEVHFGDAGEGRAIAWIRFGETTDKEGNHVLVIDEIQSKRHQEGREQGYQKEPPADAPEVIAYKKADKEYDDYLAQLRSKYKRDDISYGLTEEENARLNELYNNEFNTRVAYNQYLQENHYGAFSGSNIPDAPFDKNWHELAMKRMLRYAAENGYDKIAWTTGEQQAARYNIGGKIKDIAVHVATDGLTGEKLEGQYDVFPHDHEGDVINVNGATGLLSEEQIFAMYGKSLGQRMIDAAKENPDGGVIEGEDLRIGAEGMKGFYDQMLPRFMDKYGKKWGVKTGKIELPDLEEAGQTMWAVDVTPEMKASVMQGQTMFRKGNEDVPNAVTDEMRTTAVELATKLGVKVNIVDDVNSITHDNKKQQERRRNAKGWYNTATGEVTIVLPNNRNVDDVVATTLHEVVAHKGLREMVGEERYNEFLDEIYSHLNKELKEKVDKDAFDMFTNGLGKSKDTMKEHRRVAVDELLGKLAEKGFEDFTEGEKSIWQRLKEAVLKVLNKFLDTLKLPKWFTLGDNELRYILWRSKERMERGKESPIDMAKDNIKRRELKLNDGDLYSSTETDDIWNDNSLSMSEKIASVKVRLAQNQSDNKTLRNEALQQLGTSLSDLRKAMRLQRDFDQSTVKRVSDLARIMMKGGYLRGLGTSDFDSILAAVKNSVGHDNVEGAVQRLMDIMIDNQLKNAEKVLKALETIKGKKVNESGVEVIGELDPRGQRMMEVFKKVRRWKPEDIENAINNALDRMGSDDNAVAEEAANEYAGLMLAQNYVDTIIASEVEEAELRKEIKEAHDNASESDRRTPAYRDLIRSLNDAIRENKIERAEAYIDLAQRMGADLKHSIENAKDFKEAEKIRINEIHHNANSDMEGRPAKEHYKPKFMDKFVNNSFVQFLFAPLSTFEQMMRLFGRKSADGEGYLYNRYMRGWVDARQKEIKGVREKFAILDDKAKELFGGKVKSWGDLIRYVGKLPKGEVVFKNGGNEEVYTMTQGNLLYIYMIDKMLDGQMKLRKMGITEADVEKIAENIDSRLLALGDWLQNEFLVDCRNEYNETHKRVFGASMAAIENYFPLKILKNALNDKAEDLDKPQYTDGITTITGSIIKRRRNTNPIDIFNADALNLILEHVANMEHWNAFTEFNRDLNTLRTYKRFRNQVFNMTTIYGSGKELWDKFNNVCQMAAGTYKPPRAKFDEAAVNFAKGVTASKVSFRLYTAIKQLASMPAYIPDTRADFLLKNIIMPKKAWDWSMENLPIFNERWKSRLSGNPRLLKSDMDWRMWRTRIVELASRVGMSPNAFVDAVTVSIGAHAIYETRYNRYMKEGYEPEVAHKKALQDAEIGYNLTQQSSEGAFTSTIQVDRSWLSVLFSIFRNASMSYQRQLHNSLRNFKKNLGTVGKETSVEFMTKQFVREGMDADTAEANARRRFNRQMLRDALSVATFGCIMQLCWNIFKYLPYLLFGDDDTEKDKMWNDIMAQTVAAPVEGLTGGDVYSELTRMAITGEGSPAHASKDMPITSDATYMLEKIWQGKSDEALSDMVNIIVASGVGINPQTITDTVLAIMDACGDDPALAHEATLFAFRVLQVPQSQIDKLYFDEVGLSGEEASKYSMEELAERYARYKVKRGRFFAFWAWDDKEALGKAKKKAQKAIKERVDRLGGKEQNDKYAEYEEKYKAIADEVKAAKEVGEKNKKKGDAMLDALYNDKEKKGLYDTFKKLDKGLDDLAKRYLKAINENEAELYHNSIEEYKQLAVKVLESPDSISREKNEKELKALLDRVFKEMKEIEE